MASANYLDDEEDLLPSSEDGTKGLPEQQNESDFENDVAAGGRMPPVVMVQTPKGPLPVVINHGEVGDDDGTNGGPGGGYQPPPPGAGQTGDDDGSPAPQGGPAQAGPPAIPPGARFGAPTTPDADPLLKAVSQAPVMKQPKWWQRLAAAGFGGLAGWSNAASRTRTPINIGAVGDNILHPGYSEEMERYQTALSPIQQGYNIEAARNAAAYKNLGVAAKAQLENAQAQQNIERGAYWLARARQQPHQYYTTDKGVIFDTATRQVVYAPQTQDELVQARIKAGMSPRDAQMSVYNPTHFGVEPKQRNMSPADVLMHPKDFTPEEVRNAQTIFDREHRGPNEVAAELARARMEEHRANQNTAINTGFENTKNKLLQEREQALAKLQNGQGANVDVQAATDAINRDYANRLQSAQNVYEQNVRGHGNQSEHWVVKVGPMGQPVWEKAGVLPAPPPIGSQPPQPAAQQTAPAANKPSPAAPPVAAKTKTTPVTGDQVFAVRLPTGGYLRGPREKMEKFAKDHGLTVTHNGQ